MESKLKFVSLGYVVDDIEEDKKVINAVPIESIPNTDGDITSEANAANNITVNNKDNSDVVNVYTVNKTNTVSAVWIAIENSNRITPPGVCKGETVRLFKYSDNDQYYWATLYNELDIRKREKVVYAYSNKASVDIPIAEVMGKTYWHMIDTINKKVAFHTDDSDGELTTYDIQLDTKKGVLTIADGRDNVIQLDSSKDQVNLKCKTLDSRTEINRAFTNKFSVTNGGVELIHTLVEFVNSVITYTDTANNSTSDGTISDLLDIKDKLSKFI